MKNYNNNCKKLNKDYKQVKIRLQITLMVMILLSEDAKLDKSSFPSKFTDLKKTDKNAEVIAHNKFHFPFVCEKQ